MGSEDERPGAEVAAVTLAAALAEVDDLHAVAARVAAAVGTAAGAAAVVLVGGQEPQACVVAGRHGPPEVEARVDHAWVLQAVKSGEPLTRAPAAPGEGQVSCLPLAAGTGAVVLAYPPGNHRDIDTLGGVNALAQVGAIALARARAVAAHRQLEADRDRLLARLVTAEEDERRRIADGLHGDAIQALAAGLTDLKLVDAGPELRRVQRARDRVEQALRAARTLLFNLRPPVLDARGLGPAVRQQLDAVVEETGCAGTLDWDTGQRHHRVTELLVFRTVQEALTNVVKHARPGHVAVHGRRDGPVIEVTVADDGAGFDADQAAAETSRRGHLGLRSMAERVELAGGAFELSSTPGHGTRIRFRVPLRRDG